MKAIIVIEIDRDWRDITDAHRLGLFQASSVDPGGDRKEGENRDREFRWR